MPRRLSSLLLLTALLLAFTTAEADDNPGPAFSAQTGLATYAVSEFPAAFTCSLELGYKTSSLAFTAGYGLEPFAEAGGAQGPRLNVYYYTNPYHPFSMRLGGGLEYFWRRAPFNEDGGYAEDILAARLGLLAALQLFNGLSLGVDAALLAPLNRQVGLTSRIGFAIVYTL